MQSPSNLGLPDVGIRSFNQSKTSFDKTTMRLIFTGIITFPHSSSKCFTLSSVATPRRCDIPRYFLFYLRLCRRNAQGVGRLENLQLPQKTGHCIIDLGGACCCCSYEFSLNFRPFFPSAGIVRFVPLSIFQFPFLRKRHPHNPCHKLLADYVTTCYGRLTSIPGM